MRQVVLVLALAGCGTAPPAPPAEVARDGSRLVWIPPGAFLMGSHEGDEAPVHEVQRSRGCWIGEREVTWGQLRRFCVETGRAAPEPAFPVTDEHPAHGVTWDEAAAYCAWAGLRLPTEAEWERAAAGPARRRYPWGDDEAPGRANWAGDADGHVRTAPVGALAGDRSPEGCLDMAGNVREWVADWHAPYPAGPVVDPAGPPAGERRVLRGGSWDGRPYYGRTTNRKRIGGQARDPAFGFRVARDGP